MPNITIIGGGFGGATLAKNLMGRLPAGWDVVLISEDSYTTYNPLLPEVVGASIFPEHAVAPLREVIDVQNGGRFVMAAVSAVDLDAREVVASTLVGECRFAFDHLVLAVGNRARVDLIPGMAEHALPLKSVGDALHIRNIVLRRLAAMELEPDAARRALLGHFLVIGGGFSGVEVAGAMIDCIKGIGKYFPHAMSDIARVTLVHSGDRLLPEMAPKLGAAALRQLRRRGVDVQLQTAAASIDAEGADLRDGRRVDAGTVVATIGNRPNRLVAALGSATERGRLTVADDLTVAGLGNVWALGDCAHAINGADGAACPPTAQFAVAQAKHLADSLIAVASGGAAAAFMYTPRGAMAATGHLNGVAEIFGLRLAGLAAWLAWRGYYLLLLPTWGRKVRVWIEWTWGMFFAPDITHIHFVRSGGGSGAPMVAQRRGMMLVPEMPVIETPRD
ncbi:MAG: NAD(P)/FAD-dependent oxidoreductase [Polymorphobacter sp.]